MQPPVAYKEHLPNRASPVWSGVRMSCGKLAYSKTTTAQVRSAASRDSLSRIRFRLHAHTCTHTCTSQQVLATSAYLIGPAREVHDLGDASVSSAVEVGHRRLHAPQLAEQSLVGPGGTTPQTTLSASPCQSLSSSCDRDLLWWDRARGFRW